MFRSRWSGALFVALLATLPSAGQAQVRKLKVVSADTMPIPFAYVTVEGGYGQITDENGEVSLDQILNANDVAAIEVYNRGGNVPVTLSTWDQACGIIAIWTGSRKP